MRIQFKTKEFKIIIVLLYTAALGASCNKFVEIDKAPDQLLIADAYKEDATATSAVLALYGNDYTTNSLAYFSFLGGVESDEMVYTLSSTPGITEFERASVLPTNTTLLTYLWTYPYAAIRTANIAIYQLNNSSTLTPALKTQLLGECKFFRAFFYFNLVNYFGNVPLVLTTNTNADAFLPRTSADSVWQQILSDLKDAESTLPTTYAGTLRTRVNKYAATALLARAYLYTKDYVNAEVQATKVIAATDISYGLPAPAKAFLNSSNEVIFQIATTSAWSNLPVLGTYYLSYGEYELAPSFGASFEPGDKRSTNWTNGTAITKYQLAGDEYNIVLRLAEQYLIRAEARAQLNKVSGSQQDLDSVRLRAGLGTTSASNQVALLNAVAQERKVELFGEFSHRWFDLKRTSKADALLKVLKPTTWQATDVLQPIPASERIKNPALTQNDGYPK